MMRTWCEQLLASLRSKASELFHFLWLQNFDLDLRMRGVSGPWGPPEQILVVRFEFRWLALLLVQNLPMASKKCNGLERN